MDVLERERGRERERAKIRLVSHIGHGRQHAITVLTTVLNANTITVLHSGVELYRVVVIDGGENKEFVSWSIA